MTTDFIEEAARRTPVRFSTDVLVVGGGTAGILAGMTAGRTGLSAILTESSGFLGGVATLGLGMCIGRTAPAGVEHGGFTNEFLNALTAPGPEQARVTWDPVWGRRVWHDPEDLKTKAFELIRAAGTKVLLHSLLVGVFKEGDRVAGGLFEAKSGRFAVRSKVLIDCTGDADAAAYAGAPFEMSDPSEMQSANINFVMGGVDRERADAFRRDQEAWARLVAKGRAEGMLQNVPEGVRVWWYFETMRPTEAVFNTVRVGGYNWLDPEDLTEAEYQARRQMNDIVAFLRKHAPGFENSYLSQASSQIAIRESRRIIGDYQMTEEDVVGMSKFPDGVIRSDAALDDVMPGGKPIPLVQVPKGGWFQIPFRAMLPQGVDGIIVAGRAISSTHRAQTATRQMSQCMVMGEVAATAAALAIREDVQPRELPAGTLLEKITAQGLRPSI